MKSVMKDGYDFKSLSNAQLESYIEMIQQLSFAYQFDGKYVALNCIWKDLTNEHTDRLAKKANKSFDHEMARNPLKAIRPIVKVQPSVEKQHGAVPLTKSKPLDPAHLTKVPRLIKKQK